MLSEITRDWRRANRNMRASIEDLRLEITQATPRPEAIRAARTRFAAGYVELQKVMRHVLRHVQREDRARAEELIADIVDAETRTLGRLRLNGHAWEIEEIVEDWQGFRRHSDAMTRLAFAWLDQGDILLAKTFGARREGAVVEAATAAAPAD